MTRIRPRHVTDDDLTLALHALDASPPVQEDRSHSVRAIRDLDRILRTAPGEERTFRPTTPTAPWRRRLWLLPVGGALGVAVVASSMLNGGAPSTTAAWSAVPTDPTAQQREAARDQCVDFHASQQRLAGQAPVEAEPAEIEEMTLLLAERRGPWTFALLTGPDGLNADCLLHDDPDQLAADTSDEASLSTGSGAIRHVDPPALAPEHIEPFTWRTSYVDIGGYSTLTGRVGPDVTGVIIDTPDDRRVTATVENGHWAAWWPVDSDTPRGTDPMVTATLEDGTRTEPVLLDDLFPH